MAKPHHKGSCQDGLGSQDDSRSPAVLAQQYQERIEVIKTLAGLLEARAILGTARI